MTHTVSNRRDEIARHYGVVLTPMEDRLLLAGPGLVARCAFTGTVIRQDSAGWVRNQIRTHEFPIIEDRTSDYEAKVWAKLWSRNGVSLFAT